MNHELGHATENKDMVRFSKGHRFVGVDHIARIGQIRIIT